jgi:hypothetical protein
VCPSGKGREGERRESKKVGERKGGSVKERGGGGVAGEGRGRDSQAQEMKTNRPGKQMCYTKFYHVKYAVLCCAARAVVQHIFLYYIISYHITSWCTLAPLWKLHTALCCCLADRNIPPSSREGRIRKDIESL